MLFRSAAARAADAKLSIAMGWWTQTQHCHGIVVGRQSATLAFAATSDGLLPRARVQMRDSALPWGKGGKKKRAYDTAYSQAVTHPSTNAAQSCLTSVIGRELVFSTWYGRRH